MEKKIAQASRAFGTLRKVVFQDLTLVTKRKVNQACVAVWVRMLDTTEETHQQAQLIPSPVLMGSPWDLQQASMGPRRELALLR